MLMTEAVPRAGSNDGRTHRQSPGPYADGPVGDDFAEECGASTEAGISAACKQLRRLRRREMLGSGCGTSRGCRTSTRRASSRPSPSDPLGGRQAACSSASPGPQDSPPSPSGVSAAGVHFAPTSMSSSGSIRAATVARGGVKRHAGPRRSSPSGPGQSVRDRHACGEGQSALVPAHKPALLQDARGVGRVAAVRAASGGRSGGVPAAGRELQAVRVPRALPRRSDWSSTGCGDASRGSESAGEPGSSI